MKDHRMYVIVRNDLPSLNPGKAMAQVNHAGTQASSSLANENEYREWVNQAKGFGTTIVLQSFIDEMKILQYECNNRGLKNGMIVDPTYPFIMNKELRPFIEYSKERDYDFKYLETKGNDIMCTRKEETCLWVFVKESQLEEWEYLASNLALHP